MILALTPQVLMAEIAEATKIRLAQAFGCYPTQIKVIPEIVDGRFEPKFEVPGEIYRGLSPKDAEEVIRGVYWRLKLELRIRREDLESRRTK